MMRLGYVLSEDKKRKINFPSFSTLCKKRNIQLIELDLSTPITVELDVVLCKVTDQLMSPVKEHRLQVQHLQDFLREQADVLQVEPISIQLQLTDRRLMCDSLKKIENNLPSDVNVRNPKYCYLESVADLEATKQMELPFVCKPVEACGSDQSHCMKVLFRRQDLDQELEFPFVVQEFVPHSETLLKVFVIGETIKVVRRKSLPSFTNAPKEPLHFSSQKLPLSSITGAPPSTAYWDVPPEHLQVIAKHVADEFQVSMFGFDLIIDARSSCLAIIDVNYFPGFIGFEDLHNVLLDHITHRFEEHCLVSSSKQE